MPLKLSSPPGLFFVRLAVYEIQKERRMEKQISQGMGQRPDLAGFFSETSAEYKLTTIHGKSMGGG